MIRDDVILQEHIFNLPEGKDYLFQWLSSTGWKSDTYLLSIADGFLDVEELDYHDRAVAIFRSSSDTCRVVKVSRYLVDGKVTICEIIKYKEQRG